jgi:hypothetical protein
LLMNAVENRDQIERGLYVNFWLPEQYAT